MPNEPDLSRLNICFLAGTLGQGGAERQLYYIVKALKETGARVRLLSLTQGEYWEARLRQLGVPVTWVGRNGSKLLRLKRICRELRDDPPDIFQGAHFFTNLYVSAASRILGLREVGAIRSDVINEIRNNGRLLGPLSLRFPRTIAVNSPTARRMAERYGVPADRLHLVSNVVETDRFQPGTERSAREAVVLAVGRMTREKRYDRLLQVVSRVRARSSRKVKLVIVGDGPLRAELESLAVDLGLAPEGVEFRGSVDDLAPAYREADVLLLTSDYEGTPNVVLEAMASGLPVVATKVGGVPDLIEPGVTGYCAEPLRPDLLVAALLELVEDDAKRAQFGARARAYVEERHAARQLPGALQSLYRAALA